MSDARQGDGRGAFADPGPGERPRTPDKSYGVPRRGGKFVDWDFVLEQLRSASDYWVATIAPDGRPHAAPIWGLLDQEDLYLETSPATFKARNLARDPRATVHIGGGTAVVIIDGEIHPFLPDEETGRRIAPLVAAKYPGYEPAPHDWDGGGLYRVVPHTVLAWREMNTATRWRLRR